MPKGAPASARNPAGQQRFPAGARITRREDFERVFAMGRRYSTRYFTLLATPAPSGPRLGLVVGRKVARRAVDRNRLRRLAREAFRHARLPSLDVLVLARPGLRLVDNALLRQDLEHGFVVLAEKCVKS